MWGCSKWWRVQPATAATKTKASAHETHTLTAGTTLTTLMVFNRKKKQKKNGSSKDTEYFNKDM